MSDWADKQALGVVHQYSPHPMAGVAHAALVDLIAAALREVHAETARRCAEISPHSLTPATLRDAIREAFPGAFAEPEVNSPC